MKSVSVMFAEWLGQNHYQLHNITNGIHYWKNEYGVKTSQELFDFFLENVW